MTVSSVGFAVALLLFGVGIFLAFLIIRTIFRFIGRIVGGGSSEASISTPNPSKPIRNFLHRWVWSKKGVFLVAAIIFGAPWFIDREAKNAENAALASQQRRAVAEGKKPTEERDFCWLSRRDDGTFRRRFLVQGLKLIDGGNHLVFGRETQAGGDPKGTTIARWVRGRGLYEGKIDEDDGSETSFWLEVVGSGVGGGLSGRYTTAEGHEGPVDIRPGRCPPL